VKQATDEIASMTPAEQDAHFLCRAVEHCIRMHQLNAPQCLIDRANRNMHRHFGRLRRPKS